MAASLGKNLVTQIVLKILLHTLLEVIYDADCHDLAKAVVHSLRQSVELEGDELVDAKQSFVQNGAVES